MLLREQIASLAIAANKVRIWDPWFSVDAWAKGTSQNILPADSLHFLGQWRQGLRSKVSQPAAIRRGLQTDSDVISMLPPELQEVGVH